MSDDLRTLFIHVCQRCLNNEGGECHTPGCMYWICDAPQGVILARLRDRVLTALPEADRDEVETLVADFSNHNPFPEGEDITEGLLFQYHLIPRGNNDE